MSLNVVIIGAVAMGPKAACRLKRLMPDARVTVVDKDSIISYGGCGIPYFVSGDVNEEKQLRDTSFHVVRDENYFRSAKGVEVLTRTEALSIDRQAKTVRVKNLDSGEERDLPYDKLVLATGSRPNRLNIPGADLEGVFCVATLNDAIKIRNLVSGGQVGRAVVIGGGAIGLEMTEALADLWGVETALVEIQNQLLPGIISPNLSQMIKEHLHEREVEEVYLSESVLRLEGEDGQVARVVTDQRTLETDLVIMAVGVRPNVDLAREAGLELSPLGAILVNDRLETSDPDIYAGGDCIDNLDLVTGQRLYMSSGSLANRQGRIIGSNLAGAHDTFDGIVGSFILKVFDLSAAAAGLSLARAKAEGFDAFSAMVLQADRAHFYPGMELMYLELIVEKPTGRVLGIAGLSPNGDALSSRINAVAPILKNKPTTRDISNLEMAYAPPYASAMDILNALGNTAENILTGRNRTIDVDEFADAFASRENGDVVCLDLRTPGNAEPFVEKYPDYWIWVPHGELTARLDEVPRDKQLLLLCNSGVQSYEAQVKLDHAGITNTRNLQGGVGALKKWGLKLV